MVWLDQAKSKQMGISLLGLGFAERIEAFEFEESIHQVRSLSLATFSNSRHTPSDKGNRY